MYYFIRMTDTKTVDALVAAGRELFPTHGYDGTSIRAITKLAGANLGAVTYHFGSKAALYEAVLASLAQPFRETLAQAAQRPGPALARIEAIVVAIFDYLKANPEFPRLMIQHLASGQPLPEPGRMVLEANVGILNGLITEGQRDGTIRKGEAGLLAVSIIAQPIWFTLVQNFLAQATSIDQSDPLIRQRVVDAAVGFVRAGLAVHSEDSQ
jgi:AcrR family transcriptional regulator